MKLTEIKTTDENGEEAKLSFVDYRKYLLTSVFTSMPSYESEAMGTVQPDKIVKHIVESVAQGKAVEEGIAESYPDVVERVTRDCQETVGNKESKAAEAAAASEAKKAAAEAAKKEKEEKATAQLAVQTTFVENLATGIKTADSEFESDLIGIKTNLPTGITVIQKGHGFGILIDKDTTQEDVGMAMGYLIQKSENSSLIGNQLQFWVGDMVASVTESGLFATAKDAGKFISDLLLKNYGKTLTASNIDANKRMAQRTPIELRNPRADSTAYLYISNAKLPKIGSDESKEDFKKRLDVFNQDIIDLQTKLASGEVLKRKDIMPLLDSVLIKNGIKEAPDGNNEPSVSQRLAQYFHACFALENLVGVHKKDEIHYKDAESIKFYTKLEMEDVKAEAEAALANVFYSSEKKGITIKDICRGFVETTKKVVVGKTADGANIEQDDTTETKVYPSCPFASEEEEAKTDEVKETTKDEAAVEANTKDKKAKK